ncbi:carbohydrate-binding protein [Crossiella equi]|uniref:carbohydrate-binding protein n=1 Tax=Crossiella equi TaxID=130796 RepID=UPI0020112539|nr:carbohydrate-binding protein [Crossiella equi]
MGASYYDEQRGTALERCQDSGCGQNVGWLAPGDYTAYADVDFGATPARSVTLRLASGSTANGSVQFRLGSPTGPVVATVPAASTGGWQTWASRTAAVSANATGVQRLYLVAAGTGTGDVANVNWFQFSR